MAPQQIAMRDTEYYEEFVDRMICIGMDKVGLAMTFGKYQKAIEELQELKIRFNHSENRLHFFESMIEKCHEETEGVSLYNEEDFNGE